MCKLLSLFSAVRLAALGQCARALLQDAQERLVFRAHVHLRADVLLYRPAQGDLAYPHKLLMMEVGSQVEYYFHSTWTVRARSATKRAGAARVSYFFLIL